jgi:hypothetical protein
VYQQNPFFLSVKEIVLGLLISSILLITYKENMSTELLSNLIYDSDCFANLQKDSTAAILVNLVHDKKTPDG